MRGELCVAVTREIPFAILRHRGSESS
jgi:hypothetical protein